MLILRTHFAHLVVVLLLSSFILLSDVVLVQAATNSESAVVCLDQSVDSAIPVNDSLGAIGKCVYAFGPMHYNDRLYPGEFLCDVTSSPDSTTTTTWAFGIKKDDYSVILINVKTGQKRVISDDGEYGCYLRMQGDGNLVLKDRNDSALWKSGTARNFGSKLYVRCYGEVQIVKPDEGKVIWKMRQDSSCIDNYLYYGAKLRKGEYICYGNQFFGMNKKGDLIYFDEGKKIWSKGTGEDDAEYLEMKDDGNLVVYDDDDDRVWETGTTSSQTDVDMRGATLILDYKGVYIKSTDQDHFFWWDW